MKVFHSVRGWRQNCGNYAGVMESVPSESLMSLLKSTIENWLLGKKKKKVVVFAGEGQWRWACLHCCALNWQGTNTQWSSLREINNNERCWNLYTGKNLDREPFIALSPVGKEACDHPPNAWCTSLSLLFSATPCLNVQHEINLSISAGNWDVSPWLTELSLNDCEREPQEQHLQ